MKLREYKPTDCKQLAELFYQTIHHVNAKDYSAEQLAVWASGSVDLRKWDQSFREHHTVVAVENGKIVGFGDMTPCGYLDRLFVHKDYQSRGIATAICRELEQRATGKTITVRASVTAKSFFEHRGYHIVRKENVFRNGIFLPAYQMEK